MNIVIAGAGEVGSHLAKLLVEGNHEITVIEYDEDRLRRVSELGDLLTINGHPTSFEILERANVDKADLFIAVSTSKEQDVNIISAAFAKQMGAKKVIARINNEEYLNPERGTVFASMGIDYLFYPEKNAMHEILDLLKTTGSTEYMSFSNGKLQLIAYKLEEGAPVIDKMLKDISVIDQEINYRVVAIARGGKTIIPDSTEELKVDDTVFIISVRKGTDKIISYTGKSNIDVKNVLILGGTRIGEMLASALEEEITKVKLIDANRERCEQLAEKLSDTLVIHGDIRNTELLIEEDVKNVDVVVAVTGSSETNILSCILAKQLGVKKTIAEIEDIDYIPLAENMGVDTVINKKLLTVSRIFRFTMGSNVQSVRLLNGSIAEVLEFIVKADSPVTKAPIKDLHFPKDAIIGGIIRGNSSFIAVGDKQIKAYDRVVVVTMPSAITEVNRFFQN